jgi:hypothetical protein
MLSELLGVAGHRLWPEFGQRSNRRRGPIGLGCDDLADRREVRCPLPAVGWTNEVTSTIPVVRTTAARVRGSHGAIPMPASLLAAALGPGAPDIDLAYIFRGGRRQGPLASGCRHRVAVQCLAGSRRTARQRGSNGVLMSG